MFFKQIKNVIKIIIILPVFIILLFNIFGFSLKAEMNYSTANCLFSGHPESICKMKPLGHIEEWHNMFTMIPTKDSSSILYTLIALLVLLISGLWKKSIHDQHWSKIHINSPDPQKYKIFDFLKEAFASGIINPKIF